MSNLCGCRVGVLAAGGGSDAVSLEDLLSLLQHGLIAELQVELQTDREKNENLFTLKSGDYTVITAPGSVHNELYRTVNFVYPSIFTTLPESGFKAALCRIYL